MFWTTHHLYVSNKWLILFVLFRLFHYFIHCNWWDFVDHCLLVEEFSSFLFIKTITSHYQSNQINIDSRVLNMKYLFLQNTLTPLSIKLQHQKPPSDHPRQEALLVGLNTPIWMTTNWAKTNFCPKLRPKSFRNAWFSKFEGIRVGKQETCSWLAWRFLYGLCTQIYLVFFLSRYVMISLCSKTNSVIWL